MSRVCRQWSPAKTSPRLQCRRPVYHIFTVAMLTEVFREQCFFSGFYLESNSHFSSSSIFVGFCVSSCRIVDRAPANTRRWPNAGLRLDQSRRRRANISSTLGKQLVFGGTSRGLTLGTQRFTNVESTSWTLIQRCCNVPSVSYITYRMNV